MHQVDHTGVLYVVGLGPGAPELLTPAAAAALDAADTVVGYHGYLELIADRLEGKSVVGRELGQEIERAQAALERAEQGHTVALVSSGDAGIYGMGGVAWELASEHASPVEIRVIPGVTAACSAAARLGAPLAHDWACLSLSDLLTPWDVIVQRVEAAARADLVLVFYNPASRTRDWQLGAIAQRLLGHRAPSTPVGLVENAFRPGERVEVIRLDDLANATPRVSMFTTVIVGSSTTFVANGRMVTPRIYAARQDNQTTDASAPTGRSDPTDAPTSPGARIMAESLARIDRELGPEPRDPDIRAVVRRMIHASADFDYAANVRFAPGAISAAVAGLKAGATVIADVAMLRAGIRRDLTGPLGISVLCGLDEPETARLARSAGLTRSAAGLRRIAAQVGDGALLAIGNAPTALDEALRLIEHEGWRPSCVVGIPVGFVGVVEAKQRLVSQALVPFITSLGRKGGTAVTAAVVNALLSLAGEGERKVLDAGAPG
jgi:precorrin-3B C17-methyltransferase